MNVLLDTNFLIEVRRRNSRAITAFEACDSAAISAITVGELAIGSDTGELALLREVLLSIFADGVPTMPVTEPTAAVYGTIGRALRRTGKPIPTNDLWIAATAIEHNLTLLTFDKHFARVAELQSVIL